MFQQARPAGVDRLPVISSLHSSPFVGDKLANGQRPQPFLLGRTAKMDGDEGLAVILTGLHEIVLHGALDHDAVLDDVSTVVLDGLQRNRET